MERMNMTSNQPQSHLLRAHLHLGAVKGDSGLLIVAYLLCLPSPGPFYLFKPCFTLAIHDRLICPSPLTHCCLKHRYLGPGYTDAKHLLFLPATTSIPTFLPTPTISGSLYWSLIFNDTPSLYITLTLRE